jgi:hypothetical protein
MCTAIVGAATCAVHAREAGHGRGHLGREAEGGRARARRRTTPRRSVAGPTAARSKTMIKMSCSRPRRLPANERLATAVLAPRPLLRIRCCTRADSGRARLRTSRRRVRRRLGDGGLMAAGMISARRRRLPALTRLGALAVGYGRRGRLGSRCDGRRLRGCWATCVRHAETVR